MAWNVIQSFNAPGGVCIDIDYDAVRDVLWVADTGVNRIFKVDPSTGQTISTSSSITGCDGVAYDSSRDVLWLTDNGNEHLVKVDPDTGTEIDRISFPNTVDRVEGISYDATRDVLWVAGLDFRGDGAFFAVDANAAFPNMTIVETLTPPTTTFNGPLGVTFVPGDDNLWYVEETSQAHLMSIADSNLLDTFATPASTSVNGGIAWDAVRGVLWFVSPSSDTIYKLAPPNPTAAFSWAFPFPETTPRQVNFDATASDDGSGGSNLTYAWDFGDGTPVKTGATPTHTYAAFDTYTVTLTVTNAALLQDTLQQAVLVEDTRPPPRESEEEVFNLEHGLHIYEPLYTTGGDAVHSQGGLREYTQETVPNATTTDLITYTALKPTTITNIRVSGDHDGVFRVLLNGTEILPARRIYHSQQGEDLLDGAAIGIEIGDVLVVRVENTAEADNGVYQAAIIGRKS